MVFCSVCRYARIALLPPKGNISPASTQARAGGAPLLLHKVSALFCLHLVFFHALSAKTTKVALFTVPVREICLIHYE
jgi:hypothetical protein